MSNQEKYFSEKHLAAKWNISPKTLQRWRWLNMGPSYIKIGGRVRCAPGMANDSRVQVPNSG